MVLPILIGGLIIGGSAWMLDKAGVLDMDDAGEEIGEVIGKVIAGMVRAIPEVIEEAGPAVVDGVAGAAVATRESLRGREAALAMGLTVLAIGLTSYWAVKGTLIRPRPPV